MRRFPSFHLIARRLSVTSLLSVFAALAAGCATTAPPQAEVAARVSAEVVGKPAPELIPIVRYGRYTLVELAPTAAQQDLLLQVVDVAIPDTLHASVGDALRHVLQRSGYRLCDAHDADALLTLPLPVVHYRLGPVVLRDALLTLVGPAWDLQVDDGTRRVCFTRSAREVPEPQQPPMPEIDVQVETFPLAREVAP